MRLPFKVHNIYVFISAQSQTHASNAYIYGIKSKIEFEKHIYRLETVRFRNRRTKHITHSNKFSIKNTHKTPHFNHPFSHSHWHFIQSSSEYILYITHKKKKSVLLNLFNFLFQINIHNKLND